MKSPIVTVEFLDGSWQSVRLTSKGANQVIELLREASGPWADAWFSGTINAVTHRGYPSAFTQRAGGTILCPTPIEVPAPKTLREAFSAAGYELDAIASAEEVQDALRLIQDPWFVPALGVLERVAGSCGDQKKESVFSFPSRSGCGTKMKAPRASLKSERPDWQVEALNNGGYR